MMLAKEPHPEERDPGQASNQEQDLSSLHCSDEEEELASLRHAAQPLVILDTLSTMSEKIRTAEGGLSGLVADIKIGVLFHLAGDKDRCLTFLEEAEKEILHLPAKSKWWLLAKELAPAYARLGMDSKFHDITEAAGLPGEEADFESEKADQFEHWEALQSLLSGSKKELFFHLVSETMKTSGNKTKGFALLGTVEAYLKFGDFENACRFAECLAEAMEAVEPAPEESYPAAHRCCLAGTLLAKMGRYGKAEILWRKASQLMTEESLQCQGWFSEELTLAKNNVGDLKQAQKLTAELEAAGLGSSIANMKLWKTLDAACSIIERELLESELWTTSDPVVDGQDVLCMIK